MIISLRNLTFQEYVEKLRRYGLDYKTMFKMLKKGYAPLNFDADNKKQAIKIAKELKKRFGKRYTILFRKSSSRRGYHFTVFKDGKQLFLPAKKVLSIRKKCHDCYGRIEADELRIKHKLPISILFNHKNLREATAWRELKGDLR